MIVYTNKVSYAEHVALVKGDVASGDPVLVRMHALSVMEDVLGDQGGSRGGEAAGRDEHHREAERGVVVLIREPMATSLSDRVREKLAAQAEGRRVENELRDYGVGAQILVDLGVRDMVLLSNTRRTIIGLEGYGLSVTDQLSLTGAPFAAPEED